MPTEFACTIDTDGTPGAGGVDFASLAAWQAAMAAGPAPYNAVLLHSTDTAASSGLTNWVVPGTLSGTIAANSAVTQAVTNAKATLIYHNQAGQAFLRASTSSQPDDVHAWSLDSAPSNTWTPTGARDTVTLSANCRGTTADTTPLAAWNKVIGFGLVNRVILRGNSGPAELPWNTSEYRLEVDTLSGVIVGDGTPGAIELENFQARNSSTATGSWTDSTSVLLSNGLSVRARSCRFRGGRNTVYLLGGITRVEMNECVIYGANKAGALVQATKGTLIARHGTIIGATYGVRTDTGGATAACENVYAHGGTAAFSAANSGTITLRQCASSDATAAGGSGLTVLGTPLASIAHSTATFLNVTAGSEDYRRAASSPLSYAGANLSAGRSRQFMDVSSADEANNGAPLGVLAFEVGSRTAVVRLYDTVNDRWYDGVSTGKRWDLSRIVSLPNASTTNDWFVLVSDTHKGLGSKGAFDAIDRLNAGTVGNWAAATGNGWTNGTKPCTGRLKWILVLGDLCYTDDNRYGTARDDFQDLVFNTSSEAGHTGVTSIAADHIKYITGNHDDTGLMSKWNATNAWDGVHGHANEGFEGRRFNNPNGNATNQDGVAYSDPDELRYWFEVGNNRFLMLSLLGSADITHATNTGHANLAAWNAADTAWAASAISGTPSDRNLFVMVHAPLLHGSRYGKGDQYMGTAVEAALATSPWCFSACGHTHAFDGAGPDIGSVASRDDFPARAAWDIGAGESPAPYRRAVRGLRAGGRALRSIRI